MCWDGMGWDEREMDERLFFLGGVFFFGFILLLFKKKLKNLYST